MDTIKYKLETLEQATHWFESDKQKVLHMLVNT
jgi:hypothetical protein